MKLIKPDFDMRKQLQELRVEQARKLLYEFVASDEASAEVHLELSDDIRTVGELYGALRSALRRAQLNGDDTFVDVRVYYAAKYDRVYLYRNTDM